MSKDVILEMRHVTKKFPGVIALNDVSIAVNKGEIMAVCGENGAGKSTLMKILSGSYTSAEYEGEIWINGEKINMANVHTAQENGIEMVYQELNMILTSSIAENLYVGHLPGKGQRVDWKSLYQRTQEVLDQLKLKVSPKTQAGYLNSGQLQMLSIMRAVIQKPRIIVLDEPTSSLTDNEVEILFGLMERLRREGVSILFITHKLDEVFRMADRVAILRDGQMIFVDNIEDVNNESLIEGMVGRKLDKQFPKVKAPIGEEVLRVEHLTVPSPSVKGTNIVEDISFSLHKGEVLGFGGLVGAGRSEALGAVFGQITKNVKKEVYIKGNRTEIKNPRQAKKSGFGFVTEERRLTGFIPTFSICNNLTICILDKISKVSFLNKKEERRLSQSMFERMHVKAPSLDSKVITLSGGNQQKVVLGKWLLADTDILFIDEPTKGIDVAAKAEIYTQICELAAQGVGIIMVSSDMQELVAMSDRVVILNGGHVTGEFESEEITQENILKAAIKEEAKVG